MHRLDEHRELEPKSLASAGRRFPNWGAFSVSPEGDELRQAKALAQKGLCGYCECALWHDGVLPKGVPISTILFPGEQRRGKNCFFHGITLFFPVRERGHAVEEKMTKG